jgi:hypothetical protein
MAAAKAASPALTVWSETWKAPYEWLSLLETHLAESGARVKRGHDFDRWDLESIHNLLVTMRSAVLIEEHGQGRQYLKLKTRPRFFRFPVAIGILLLTGAVFTALRQHLAGSAVLTTMFLVLLIQAWRGYRQSLNRLLVAFHQLHDDATQGTCRTVSTQRTQPKLAKTPPAVITGETE